MRLVQGIGFNDGSRTASVNGVISKEYALWQAMLCRVVNRKNYPAYNGCSVSDNFKNYSYFYDWCQEQTGFNCDGFDLDKDILVKGNKQYHEDLCVFVPSEINRCFIRTRRKSDLPIGVVFNKECNKFVAQLGRNKGSKHLGCFDNQIDAFNCYKKEKEAYIKALANEYVDYIDSRVYDALMNYSVEILD